MNFPSHFIHLIMVCLSTTSFSFLINSQPKGFVKPSRGLRQGDPISPYLFLLCTEGFSALIRKAVSDGHIHPIILSRNGSAISHLLFTDDILLFTRASIADCLSIKNILSIYETESGQKINFDKSEMSFSRAISEDRQSYLCQVMGIKGVDNHVKYLGLLTLIGKSKKYIFSFLKE